MTLLFFDAFFLFYLSTCVFLAPFLAFTGVCSNMCSPSRPRAEISAGSLARLLALVLARGGACAQPRQQAAPVPHGNGAIQSDIEVRKKKSSKDLSSTSRCDDRIEVLLLLALSREVVV